MREYRYFRKLDSKEEFTPAIEICHLEATKWNKEGYGIFICPNSFKTANRRKINVSKIQQYFVDLDNGTKEQQMSKIKQGLTPSVIIESKRGYHCHWYVKDGSVAGFDSIMPHIIKFYDADRACKNYLMLLRAPNFYHLKDKDNPFLVKEIYKSDKEYSEQDLKYFYKKEEPKPIIRKNKIVGDDFFARLSSANQMDLLSRIPSHYMGEKLDFVDHRNGTYQIVCDGKRTGCWIDKNGHIGGYDKACPTVWQWLKWYGLQSKQIFEILKEVAPELWNN